MLRTGFFLEYTYDIRYAAMLAHARLTNKPIPPPPPVFLMGQFAQVDLVVTIQTQSMRAHTHLVYLRVLMRKGTNPCTNACHRLYTPSTLLCVPSIYQASSSSRHCQPLYLSCM